MDSCFCSRKRSSSSWTRWTKSFSAEERKTPSKQRRARVTDGRACRGGGQGRDQNIGLEAAHSPKCPCSKDFGDFRNPGHCGAGWEARECGAECAHIQSQAGSPASSTVSSHRVLPGLFSSRAQPAETAPQHSAVLPIRDPRRKPPTPSTLTAAARKVAAALRVPKSLSVPFFPAESAPSCGREEISHVPQRGVFLSCKEQGQGHSCL